MIVDHDANTKIMSIKCRFEFGYRWKQKVNKTLIYQTKIEYIEKK